jgi:SAM-dependent methyltransferase
MAEMGFETTALDASRSGLDYLAGEAQARGLQVTNVNGHMGSLPFGQGAFDYVLALNVIYHGDELAVRRAIHEIRRVLRPGGMFQGTLLSKRHTDYGHGREISPNTWVQERAPASDRDHPHHYCDREEVVALLDGFDLVRLIEVEQKRAGRWHWYFEAVRL